jgi:hypothetical protein
MTAAPFTDAISALSPLDDAIGGGRRTTARKPRATRAATPVATDKGWQCPLCGDQFTAAYKERHLEQELNALREEKASLDKQKDAIGPGGMRIGTDELNNPMVWGPGNAADYPIVFVTWDSLLIDPGIQRGREDGHPLLSRRAKLDYRKTEALTVAEVRIARDGGGDELLGYRPIEGQHRTFLGKADDPEGLQPCKIVKVEARQEESRLGLLISLNRSPYAKIAVWNQLEYAGQPNVVACAGLLRRLSYTVGPNGDRAIAAAGALLKIAGLSHLDHDEPTVTKDPQDAATHMNEVLTVVEGIARDRDEGSKRYSGVLLNLIASIIADNRETLAAGNHGQIEGGIDRLSRVMGQRTADEWLKLGRDREFGGGRKRIRELMCKAYNGGKQKYRIA